MFVKAGCPEHDRLMQVWSNGGHQPWGPWRSAHGLHMPLLTLVDAWTCVSVNVPVGIGVSATRNIACFVLCTAAPTATGMDSSEGWSFKASYVRLSQPVLGRLTTGGGFVNLFNKLCTARC